MILGTPGSGKSFIGKEVYLGNIPEHEGRYPHLRSRGGILPLVDRLKGQVIKISPTSTQYVNPMDINLNYSEDDNPLALKSDFILSFCELAAGGRNGLEPVEKTLIDRAVRTVYRPYMADPRPETMPILEDLYDEIKRQPTPRHRESRRRWSFTSRFAQRVQSQNERDINNRLVCFDIKELGQAN